VAPAAPRGCHTLIASVQALNAPPPELSAAILGAGVNGRGRLGSLNVVCPTLYQNVSLHVGIHQGSREGTGEWI